MSATRRFAMVYGIAFLVVGACGFVPALLTHPVMDHSRMSVPVQIHAMEGYLFGLFHVNALHSTVHLLFGILGVTMAGTYLSARRYAQIVAISYGLLTIMGLIPGLNTVFGLIPIHGNDVWLHLLLTIPAAYFAFSRTRVIDEPVRTIP